MILVKDLVDNSNLPKEFIDVLPKICDTCNSPIEISETLTILRCTNELCLDKAVHRLVAMLKDLGVKNMGESKCRKFLEQLADPNPYAIFMYHPDEDGELFKGCSMDFSWGIFDQIDSKRSMYLWEYVKIGNLPHIRDISRKLFSDYNDLDSFYNDLEEGEVDFIQNLLDIKGTEDTISVKALAVYDTLVTFKDYLYQAIDYVDIKTVNVPVLNICLSTSVGGGYRSKQDFVQTMIKKYGNKVMLNVLGSVTKSCDVLVWSKVGTETTKVKKAKSINSKRVGSDEKEILILTADEFENYLKNYGG